MKFLEYSVGSPVTIPDDVKTLVFGDLHGNVIKLVDILLMAGMLEVKNSKSYYEFLLELSDKNFIEYTKYFNLIKSNKSVYFLGDCFGDRNNFDVLKLKIFTDLHNFQNKFTIIYGNHDCAALSMVLTKKNNGTLPVNKEFEHMHYSTRLNAKDIKDNFIKLIKQHYKLCDVINNKYFLTHAPVTSDLVGLFCENHKNKDIDTIKNSINDYFYNNVFKETDNINKINSFIWERLDGYELLFYNSCKSNIIQITGHDKYESNDHIFCLDNYNGKINNHKDSEYFMIF